MKTRRHAERGSAMVEAAIVLPCLVLVVYWSSALTDVLVLKLKAAEALRYALWEMTVFKPPAQIDAEVQQRFLDLRSPKTIDAAGTGLALYPLASDLTWRASVDTTSHRGGLGGSSVQPQGGGFIDKLLSVATDGLASGVDANLKFWKFNLNGEAAATVTLVRARHGDGASRILTGGDLPGLRGGNDLGAPASLADLTLRAPLPSQRPMRLVFDTWKAWPRPKAWTLDGAPTDNTVSPAKTYPVVEEQVARQVDSIAFFGLNNLPFVGAVRNLAATVTGGGVTQAILGGRLPDVFSAERMDGPQRGPITILPPDRDASDPAWVPGRCEIAGHQVSCPTQRLGDETASGPAPVFLDDEASMGDHVDRSRYTIPYRINTEYWTESGGTVKDATSARLGKVSASIAAANEYVKTWQCRGHYFAGGIRAQESDPLKRYRADCNR